MVCWKSWKTAIGTFARLALAAAATALGAALLFEVLYRLQVVDTYRAELRAFNPPEVLEARDGRPTLLALGDSLTAGEWSYPALLRPRLPGWRIVNGGLPATGVLQANLVARRRFARFAPDVLVYQVNVSNDLLNHRFPVNWKELSVGRNLYWTISRRLRGLEYVNYRSAQLVAALRARGRPEVGPPADPFATCVHDLGPFEPQRYTSRERLYLRAEPRLVENQVLLHGGRAADLEAWIGSVAQLLRRCEPPACKARLLVVPHAAQVSEAYAGDLRLVGARFDDPDGVHRADYPFLESLRAGLARRGLGGVEIIDPLPGLREAERSGRHAYYRYDPHLTACGQEVLADAVAASVGR